MSNASQPTREAPLSADAPLENPNDDAFGYAPFAQHIVKALVEMAPADGFVISIHGPWGYGKTTLLNFVKYYLARWTDEQRPIVVSFNPWWFAGSDDLARHFFGQLSAEFSKWGRRFKALGSKLADLGDKVSDVPMPYAGLAKVTKLLRPCVRSISDLRREAEQSLRRQQQRIIVIIDDIDRLSADETRQVFRLIKAVANLPNITYVLAYDQVRVADALNDTTDDSGLAYLEKIVQAPFDLPLPERSDIRKLFLEQLNRVIATVPDDRFDQVRWANTFFEGIDDLIDSPRAVVRMMNSLRLTYAAAEGEVDPIDFIAVEALRVFAPALYNEMRWRRELLASHADFRDADARNAAASNVDALLALAPVAIRPGVRSILRRLFPRVDAMLGGLAHGSEWLAAWRKDLRIASPDVFPVYFRLRVAAGQFRAGELKSAIGLMSSERQFAAFLIDLAKQRQGDNTNRALAFLGRLEDYTAADIPIDVVPTAIKGLLLAGDDLLRSEPERSGFFEFGMDTHIARVAWQLLRRLPSEDRYKIISAGTRDAGIAVLVDWVDTVLAQHQPGRDERVRANPILTEDEAHALRAIALERIQAAAREGGLERVPHLPLILARWREWGAEGEMQRWLDPRLNDDRFVVGLVTQYVQHTLSMGLSDRAARSIPRIDLKWVERVVDVQKLLGRVQEILKENLSPEARAALQLYLDTATGKIENRD